MRIWNYMKWGIEKWRVLVRSNWWYKGTPRKPHNPDIAHHNWVVTLPSLYLRHSSFSNPPDSPTFPSLHLRHSSISNPSVALPTSQLILQPSRCFTYVTDHSQPYFRFSYVTSSSLNTPGELPMQVSYFLKKNSRHFHFVVRKRRKLKEFWFTIIDWSL